MTKELVTIGFEVWATDSEGKFRAVSQLYTVAESAKTFKKLWGNDAEVREVKKWEGEKGKKHSWRASESFQ